MCDERGTIGAGDVLSGCQLGIASSEGGEVLRRVGVGKRARSGWEGGCSFKNGQKLHFTGSSPRLRVVESLSRFPYLGFFYLVVHAMITMMMIT